MQELEKDAYKKRWQSKRYKQLEDKRAYRKIKPLQKRKRMHIEDEEWEEYGFIVNIIIFFFLILLC